MMSEHNDKIYDLTRNQTALILCESKSRYQDLEALATACNCTVLSSGWRLGQGIDLANEPVADFLLIDIPSISEAPEQSLSEVALYLDAYQSHALLWSDMELLEVAYAELPPDQCHFLVNASDIEAMPILSGALRQNAMNQLHDQGHPTDYNALHRISDELAEFARTLARLAERDDIAQSRLSGKPVSFHPAPPDAFQKFVTGRDHVEAEIGAPFVRHMIKLRRLRDSYFDSALFADPAWDILLDLIAAELEGKTVSVSSLCIAAAVPATTALRWITAMTNSGMLVRHHDPDDARRVFIALSAETRASLQQYLFDIQKGSVPLV
ncbi:MAG: hypothetical protein ABI668_07580 [Sphingorhabdus sp.]